MQNGFGHTNGFVNYNDSDVNALLSMDVTDTSNDVTPEQLNLLRLAAQEIGGAQFSNPNDKYYNFFEGNQRNSLPDTQMGNMYPQNFNRPNSLNLDSNYNNFENPYNSQRYPKFDNFKDNQDPSEILSYLSQLNISLDRNRDENGMNGMDFKMPMEMNAHHQNDDFNKMLEERNKMMFNRNFQPPNKNFENNHFFDVMGHERPMNPMNFDYSNQSTPQNPNYKPNGYHQNEFIQRQNQMMHRENFPNDQRNFDNNISNVGTNNMQQMALMRQNQELARQMSLLMRNRPPPNQLNVDVSFLHENNPFNLGK